MILDWITAILHGVAVILAALPVLIIIDSTLLRWLLKRTTTFLPTRLEGKNPESGRLLVHFPGILFDGVEGVQEIMGTLLKYVSEGVFISYGYWRFLPDEIVAKTAAWIGPPTKERNKLDIIGTSFGGKLGADLIKVLGIEYGWATGQVTLNTEIVEIKQESAVRLAMIDTPITRKVFANGGDKLSLLLSVLPVGPLVSLAVAPFLRRSYILPFDYNIEEGRNKDEVRKIAKMRMSRFWLSIICDQQRYLANENLEPLQGTLGVFVTYFKCTRNNVTVVHPFAVDEVRARIAEHTEGFVEVEVDSPHAAYLEREKEWNMRFDHHLATFPERAAV